MHNLKGSLHRSRIIMVVSSSLNYSWPSLNQIISIRSRLQSVWIPQPITTYRLVHILIFTSLLHPERIWRPTATTSLRSTTDTSRHMPSHPLPLVNTHTSTQLTWQHNVNLRTTQEGLHLHHSTTTAQTSKIRTENYKRTSSNFPFSRNSIKYTHPPKALRKIHSPNYSTKHNRSEKQNKLANQPQTHFGTQAQTLALNKAHLPFERQNDTTVTRSLTPRHTSSQTLRAGPYHPYTTLERSLIELNHSPNGLLRVNQLSALQWKRGMIQELSISHVSTSINVVF